MSIHKCGFDVCVPDWSAGKPGRDSFRKSTMIGCIECHRGSNRARVRHAHRPGPNGGHQSAWREQHCMSLHSLWHIYYCPCPSKTASRAPFAHCDITIRCYSYQTLGQYLWGKGRDILKNNQKESLLPQETGVDVTKISIHLEQGPLSQVTKAVPAFALQGLMGLE